MHTNTIIRVLIAQATAGFAFGQSCNSTGSYLALGDSYSAGPGAGGAFDDFEYDGNPCLRSNGSYPVQIATNNPFGAGIDDFQFLSCTGHVTSQVVEYQVPDIEWSGNPRVTLSIGGNDIGFADILRYCLIGLALGANSAEEHCDDAMSFAMNLLNDGDGKGTFKNSLFNVWSSVFDSAPSSPSIRHTGYPRFFNAETDVCDDSKLSIGEVFPWAPVLSKELRQQMNDLSDLLNQRISQHLVTFKTDLANSAAGLSFVDINGYWEGHRLCEEFVQDPPGFGDDNVWIFGIAGSDDDDVASDGGARSQALHLDEFDADCDDTTSDMPRAVGCTLTKLNATSEENKLAGIDLDLPEWVSKLFHPKTDGHSATRQAVLDSFGSCNSTRI